jgi:hypothetical protein
VEVEIERHRFGIAEYEAMIEHGIQPRDRRRSTTGRDPA